MAAFNNEIVSKDLFENNGYSTGDETLTDRRTYISQDR